MARKKKHEEHQNHEAWAIPYGDLVTLLFALFTVMYAVSSVNDGKFRVLSASMIAAFNGTPTSMRPVNIGEKEPGKGGDRELTGISPRALIKISSQSPTSIVDPARPGPAEAPGALSRMQRDVQDAMQALIDAKLVTVRRDSTWLEIEINADVLFPSGASGFSPDAEPVLNTLAQVLMPFPNPIRVEGHTDDRPIKTAEFPSNWELSAARAASVVHQFMRQGIDPLRLEIVGLGEFHPRQPNDTAEGRNANRRVVVLVLDQVSTDSPRAAPDLLRAAPDLLRAAPDLARAAPDLPPATPDLPRTAPDLPTAVPESPRAAPDLPRAAPALPPAAPGLPRAAPGLPRAAPRAQPTTG
jgi:chemotaxis protein MotB